MPRTNGAVWAEGADWGRLEGSPRTGKQVWFSMLQSLRNVGKTHGRSHLEGARTVHREMSLSSVLGEKMADPSAEEARGAVGTQGPEGLCVLP